MKIIEIVERYRNDMEKALCDLIEIKAISPDAGGKGEYDKAEYIMDLLDGFDVRRFDAKDDRAKNGIRPNIVAKIKGEKERTVWIISHMDVVPEGDPSLWDTDPFKAVVKDGRIYGRGAEDNNQAIVSSIFAGKAILEFEKPKFSYGLAIVSDEETGSRYGIQHLIKLGVFKRDDLIVVSDAGSERGDEIEIAEKSILWLRIKVYGIQSHASMPKLNASRRAMEFLLRVCDELYRKFDAKNDLFSPPYSTFEPTKREKNVDNVNTIPGLDVSYMDCRVLPEYSLDDVLNTIERIKDEFVKRDKMPIELEVIQKNSSPPTPERSEVVLKLKKAIETVRGIRARVVGIGGNTCASFFRIAGFHTAVWGTFVGTAHKPNEYCLIDNVVNDAKVFAALPYIE